VAHELAEFIEPVYFVAYLGNTKIGDCLYCVRLQEKLMVSVPASYIGTKKS
jgi:hypothetical protein